MKAFQENGKPIKAWIDGIELEKEAEKQLINISQMPFIYKHIAVMPDAHAGKGSTVGCVIATKGAIIPAAVGVDIGCGMIAAKTNLISSDLPDNLFNIRSAIEAAVPHGRTDNGGENDRGAWHDVPDNVLSVYAAMQSTIYELSRDHPEISKAVNRGAKQLGTLGTGNHFIELCLDENQAVWIMLHSGSRGLGNKIGSYFIQLAKKDMQKWFINLPDMDLAYLPQGSTNFLHYMIGVREAQNYARLNRELMLYAVMNVLEQQLGKDITCYKDQAINCHHNYVNTENHFGSNVFVTRKGAVRARQGDLGIIPGSMGAKSFIVRGKGNKESFDSCSHGAGRKMSRTKARSIFTIEDHVKATEGVECRKDIDVIDETPAAYKNIDDVMAAQSELVEIVHTLKQIVCVKG